MKKLSLVAFAIASSFILSCVRQEPLAPQDGSIVLSVGEYPLFDESKALGVPDPGKTEWLDGDALYIVFQTAGDAAAARYRVVRSSGSWKNFEKYSDGTYTPVQALTAPGTCRALVFYAPAYEFKSGKVLSLRSGETAGLDEFLQWNSGSGYDISGEASLNVSFVKDYSRLRAVTEKGYSVRLKSASFTPAGYDAAPLGTSSLEALADANGNAFFYGTWTDGTSFDVSTFDADGGFVFNNVFKDKPAGVNGKSYALDCQDSGDFTKISELAAMATSSGKKFDVSLRNAVVSYAIGKYAHIEDGSGALLVYLDGHGLAEGQCLNGTVSGTVKLYNGVPEITAFDYSSAAITSAENIPCTEMTLADLLNDFGANISRRILLKGITVDKGIQSGTTAKRTGKISQNGSSIVIYGTYTPSPAVLASGLYGDLIAFPTYHGSEKQLSVYEASQFTEGGSADPEDTAFARLTLMGFYSDTGSDNPTPVMTYVECADQYSFGSGSGSSFYHQFNLENGTYGILDLNSSSYRIGSELSVTANLNGVSEVHTVKVVNKTSTTAWLEDKTENVGYIIAVK